MLHILEKFFIWIHNFSYKAISKIAIKRNKGKHPKHQILNYHKFFIQNISAQDTILDLGCGNGHLAYKAGQKAQKVIGIDINENNIKKANKNYVLDNLRFICADATTYDFNEKFDKIILSNVLEHIKDRVDFLQKLHRLSNIILIRIPLENRDWLTIYKKQNNYEYRLDKTHFIEYTIKSLKNELEQTDWQLENYSIQFGELWGRAVKK